MITEMMGSIRFSKIVEAVGKPDVHVLWMDPAKDAVLQKAIKTNRVMTIHQRPVGAKTDYGTIGFEKNVSGQVLIFPKSLRSFAGKRVIGVKYDLLEWESVPKSRQAPKPEPPRSAAKKNKTKEVPETKVEQPAAEESRPARVVQFPNPKFENEDRHENLEKINEEDRPNERVEEIKNQVRKAMKILEEGKQVAAFNLLKSIVE